MKTNIFFLFLISTNIVAAPMTCQEGSAFLRQLKFKDLLVYESSKSSRPFKKYGFKYIRDIDEEVCDEPNFKEKLIYERDSAQKDLDYCLSILDFNGKQLNFASNNCFSYYPYFVNNFSEHDPKFCQNGKLLKPMDLTKEKSLVEIQQLIYKDLFLDLSNDEKKRKCEKIIRKKLPTFFSSINKKNFVDKIPVLDQECHQFAQSYNNFLKEISLACGEPKKRKSKGKKNDFKNN